MKIHHFDRFMLTIPSSKIELNTQSTPCQPPLIFDEIHEVIGIVLYQITLDNKYGISNIDILLGSL